MNTLTGNAEPSFPRSVRGVVTRHEAYGFYVSFADNSGQRIEGLVELPMVKDEWGASPKDFPPIGTLIEASLSGYTAIGHQARLSMRSDDIQRARDNSAPG